MPNREKEYDDWRDINSKITGEDPTFNDNWLTDALILIRRQDANKRQGIKTIQIFEMVQLPCIDPDSNSTNFFLVGNN